MNSRLPDPADVENRLDVLSTQKLFTIYFTLYLTAFYSQFQEKTSRRSMYDSVIYTWLVLFLIIQLLSLTKFSPLSAQNSFKDIYHLFSCLFLSFETL